jgi:hypothetical protein
MNVAISNQILLMFCIMQIGNINLTRTRDPYLIDKPRVNINNYDCKLVFYKKPINLPPRIRYLLTIINQTGD